MIDWPAKIEQAEANGHDLMAELGIDRKTLWRWKTRESKPSSDHAFRIGEMCRDATDSPAVAPLPQHFG